MRTGPCSLGGLYSLCLSEIFKSRQKNPVRECLGIVGLRHGVSAGLLQSRVCTFPQKTSRRLPGPEFKLLQKKQERNTFQGEIPTSSLSIGFFTNFCKEFQVFYS